MYCGLENHIISKLKFLILIIILWSLRECPCYWVIHIGVFLWSSVIIFITFSQMLTRKDSVCVFVCVCIAKQGKRQILGNELDKEHTGVYKSLYFLAFLQIFYKFKIYQSKNLPKKSKQLKKIKAIPLELI